MGLFACETKSMVKEKVFASGFCCFRRNFAWILKS